MCIRDSASDCDTLFGGYFLHGRCHYHVRKNCSDDEYYQQCTCYPHQTTMYSNYTCYNINGYYMDNYCYYWEFNCSGYAYNGQCYSRVYELDAFQNLLIFHIIISIINILYTCKCESWDVTFIIPFKPLKFFII